MRPRGLPKRSRALEGPISSPNPLTLAKGKGPFACLYWAVVDNAGLARPDSGSEISQIGSRQQFTLALAPLVTGPGLGARSASHLYSRALSVDSGQTAVLRQELRAVPIVTRAGSCPRLSNRFSDEARRPLGPPGRFPVKKLKSLPSQRVMVRLKLLGLEAYITARWGKGY